MSLYFGACVRFWASRVFFRLKSSARMEDFLDEITGHMSVTKASLQVGKIWTLSMN